jgi:hypothetical protein
VPTRQENPFTSISIAQKGEVTVEFIAHGSPNINNELLSIPKDKYKKDESSTFDAIRPATIEAFFKRYAWEEEQFKFTKLTLFCCNSLEFGRNLSTLMPQIQITCFKEAIQIHDDGFAYPYTSEKDPKPLDANGNVITFDLNHNPSTPHLPARSRVFSSGIELTTTDEIKLTAHDAQQSVPTSSATLSIERAMTIRGNPFERYQGNDAHLAEGKASASEEISSLPNPSISHNSPDEVRSDADQDHENQTSFRLRR